MAFDVEGARKDGVSDQEILDYLRQSRKDAFDFDGALRDGFSAKEIVDHIGGIKPGSSDGVLMTLAKDLGSGVAGTARGYADTAEVAGKKDFARFLKAGADLVAPDPKNYTAPQVKDPNKSWFDPTAYSLSQIPRAAVQSAPGMATDLVAMRLLGPVGGLGNYGARNAGTNIKERAANRTGDPNAEITDADIGIGLGTTAAESAVNLFGLKGLNLGQVAKGGFKDATVESLKTTGKAAGREATTEATQDAINQLGLKTGTNAEFDFGRTIESGLVGGATGGAFRAPRTVQDAIQSRRFEKLGIAPDEDTRYVADLLTEEGMGRSKQTAESLTKVEERLSAELGKSLSKLVSRKSTASDSDKAFAQGLVKAIKKGESLNDSDIERINQMGASSANLSRALKRFSTFSKVAGLGSRNNGKDGRSPYFAGGISDTLENLNPWRGNKLSSILAQGIGGSSVIPGVAGLALPSQLAASFTTILPALQAATATYGAARAIDALTGYRNPAAQFAQRFSSDPDQKPAGETIRPLDERTYNQPVGPVRPDFEGMARAAQASQMAEWLKGAKGPVVAEDERDVGSKFKAEQAIDQEAAAMSSWMDAASGKVAPEDARDVATRFRTPSAGERVYDQRPGPATQSPAPMPMGRPVYDEAVGPQLQTLAQMQQWLAQQQQGAKDEAVGVQGGMKALAKALAAMPQPQKAPEGREVYKTPVGPEQPPVPDYFKAARGGLKDAKSEATKVQKAMRDLNKMLGIPEGVIDEARAGTEAATDEASAVQKAMKALKKDLPKDEKPKEAPKKEPKAKEAPKAKKEEAEPKKEEKPKSISERLNRYKEMRVEDGFKRMEERDNIRDRARYEKEMLDRINRDFDTIKEFSNTFSDKKLLNKLLDDIEPYSRVSKPGDGKEYLDRINEKMSGAVDSLKDEDFDVISTLIERLDASKEKKKKNAER